MDTAKFYNDNAQSYIEKNHTLNSIQHLRDQFVQAVKSTPAPYRVLDAGSGTGRDTLAFVQEGFEVDAFDASTELAQFSTQETGVPTKVMRFENLQLDDNAYNGIWAMASLLHVTREDMPQVLHDLGQSLKEGGLLHATFKLGEAPEERIGSDGRRFTDMTEERFKETLEAMEGWRYEGLSSDRPPEQQTNQSPWLTFIVRKTGPITLKPQRRRPAF